MHGYHIFHKIVINLGWKGLLKVMWVKDLLKTWPENVIAQSIILLSFEEL